MMLDSMRFVSRLISLGAVLSVTACGWAEFPASHGAPSPVYGPSVYGHRQSSDAFINATAVRVGKGDTVYSIARRHKLSPRDLIEVNGLRPPYQLSIGQRLRLPQGRLHTVQRGENLAGIARRYGADAYAIARINSIRLPYTIYPGEKLRIPRTAATSSRVAPRARKKNASVRLLQPSPERPPRRAGGKFAWPVRGKIILNFGPRSKGLNNDGVNIAAKRGTPVRAAENGVVVYAGNEIRGFGNLLLIKHAGGWVTAYAHNETLLVKRGDKVKQGEVISKVGSTGSVTTPQLHFELRRGSHVVDPRKYLM